MTERRWRSLVCACLTFGAQPWSRGRVVVGSWKKESWGKGWFFFPLFTRFFFNKSWFWFQFFEEMDVWEDQILDHPIWWKSRKRRLQDVQSYGKWICGIQKFQRCRCEKLTHGWLASGVQSQKLAGAFDPPLKLCFLEWSNDLRFLCRGNIGLVWKSFSTILHLIFMIGKRVLYT